MARTPVMAGKKIITFSSPPGRKQVDALKIIWKMRKKRMAENRALQGHAAGTANVAGTYFLEKLPNITR